MWDDLEMRDIVVFELLVHHSLILRPRSPPVQLIHSSEHCVDGTTGLHSMEVQWKLSCNDTITCNVIS